MKKSAIILALAVVLVLSTAVAAGYFEEWKASKHARVTPSSTPMETRTGCVGCHTGPGFKNKTNDAAAIKNEPVFAIDCDACHDFESDAPAQLRTHGTATLPGGKGIAAGRSATCMYCHNALNYAADPENFKALGYPHYGPQASIFLGTGGYEVAGFRYSNSVHTAIEDSCVTCHMAKPSEDLLGKVGGHTFFIASEDGAQNLNACLPCHKTIRSFDRPAYADFDGNGITEGIQKEVHGLIEALSKAVNEVICGTFGHSRGKMIFKEAAGTDITSVPKAVYGAVYNIIMVENDGSFGVHNPVYVVQLLQQSYKELMGKDLPGAKIR